MKIQKKFFTNEDIMEVHVSKSLKKFAFNIDGQYDIMGIKKGDQILANRIRRLSGIVDVKIAHGTENRYTIWMEKGVVFEWKDIAPKILKIIGKVVAPNEKNEMLADLREDIES